MTNQMLVAPAEGGEVILLPAATRYEQEGGGTETTTERRIVFSPEIPGHQVGEARSEWRIFAELASRVRPDLRDRFDWRHQRGAARRDRRRRAALRRHRDAAHDGRLGAVGRPPPGAGRRVPDADRPRPLHACVDAAEVDLPDGAFFVSTRRGQAVQLDGVRGQSIR